MTVESARRTPLPRWAVCCWVASLHLALGRRENAEHWLGELLKMALDPPWQGVGS